MEQFYNSFAVDELFALGKIEHPKRRPRGPFEPSGQLYVTDNTAPFLPAYLEKYNIKKVEVRCLPRSKKIDLTGLEDLDFSHCLYETGRVVTCVDVVKCLDAKPNHCQRLNVSGLCRIRALAALALTDLTHLEAAYSDIDDASLKEILGGSPFIEYLNVTTCGGLTAAGLTVLLCLTPTLKTLEFGGQYDHPLMQGSPPEGYTGPEELIIRVVELDKNLLRSIRNMNSWSPLKSLSLSYCMVPTKHGSVWKDLWASGLPELIHLDVSYCQPFTSDESWAMVSRSRKLKSLDLSGTDVTLKDLIWCKDKLEDLEILVLENCTFVTVTPGLCKRFNQAGVTVLCNELDRIAEVDDCSSISDSSSETGIETETEDEGSDIETEPEEGELVEVVIKRRGPKRKTPLDSDSDEGTSAKRSKGEAEPEAQEPQHEGPREGGKRATKVSKRRMSCAVRQFFDLESRVKRGAEESNVESEGDDLLQ